MPKDVIQSDSLADLPNLQTYQKKPVQQFGMSLLKNMGFDQKKGLGKRIRDKPAEILVLKSRPKGLGLGAETNQESLKEKLLIGDLITIKTGIHSGLPGYLIEILQNQEYSIIELQPSKSKVKVAINSLQKISKKQMEQFVDEILKNKQQKKKKRLKWIVPYIKLKIVDKYSPFYLQKMVVTDLISQKQFECRDQNGKSHYEFLEKDFQTVLPPNGGIVYILKGDKKGSKARVLQRKKGKNKVTVQTLEEFQVLKLQQDDVAELVQI